MQFFRVFLPPFPPRVYVNLPSSSIFDFEDSEDLDRKTPESQTLQNYFRVIELFKSHFPLLLFFFFFLLHIISSKSKETHVLTSLIYALTYLFLHI